MDVHTLKVDVAMCLCYGYDIVYIWGFGVWWAKMYSSCGCPCIEHTGI
jgi:hypothetical protein